MTVLRHLVRSALARFVGTPPAELDRILNIARTLSIPLLALSSVLWAVPT